MINKDNIIKFLHFNFYYYYLSFFFGFKNAESIIVE